MSEPTGARLHGAIDLSMFDKPKQHAGGAGTAAGGDQLVSEVDEQSIRGVIERSARTPVLLALLTSQDQASVTLRPLLEDATRARGGRLLLAVVDVQAHPQVAAALGVQAVPMVAAAIAGQLLPLFQGAASKEQISQVIDQVLQVAEQQGVTETVPVDSAEEQEPVDEQPKLSPEQQAAQDAFDAGDFAGAASLFAALLKRAPNDEFAHHGLLRAELLGRAERRRTTAGATDTPYARADAALLAGDAAAAFNVLLDAFERADDADRANLRQRLLDFFELVGAADPAVGAARRRLANLLF